MKAFYKRGSFLVKAYDMGDDWRLIRNDGKEQWFSKWQHNEYGSLSRAFHEVVINSNEHWFLESNITLCESCTS